jgi:hypothetical protein
MKRAYNGKAIESREGKKQHLNPDSMVVVQRPEEPSGSECHNNNTLLPEQDYGFGNKATKISTDQALPTIQSQAAGVGTVSKTSDSFIPNSSSHRVSETETAPTRQPLICSVGEFCQGYFHMDKCFEWNQRNVCLCPPPTCYRSTVRGVVRLTTVADTSISSSIRSSTTAFNSTVVNSSQTTQDETKQLPTDSTDAEVLYCQKYENCYRGHTEDNWHVEDLLVRDREMLKIIDSQFVLLSKSSTRSNSATKVENKNNNINRSTPDKNNNNKRNDNNTRPAKTLPPLLLLTLYVSYQPCHHSAGSRNLLRNHSKSCTETLLRFYHEYLKPRRVRLLIKCCGLYRAHWEDATLFRNESDVQIFGNRSALARQGVHLLLNPKLDIEIQGMTRADWEQFLRQVCSAEVSNAISPELWLAREAFDQKMNSFLAKQREEVILLSLSQAKT